MLKLTAATYDCGVKDTLFTCAVGCVLVGIGCVASDEGEGLLCAFKPAPAPAPAPADAI